MLAVGLAGLTESLPTQQKGRKAFQGFDCPGGPFLAYRGPFSERRAIAVADYYGIDYGLGDTNLDKETGIRYGVIPVNDLGEWAYESMEADYGPPTCPKCGAEAGDYDSGEEGDDFEPYTPHSCSDYLCMECKLVLDSEDVFGDEPICYLLKTEGYEGIQHGDDGDLFITASPYFTHAQFCSPCAPGACYLLSPVDAGGPRAYCLGHDWFEGGKAPYPVYRVEDGSLVEPEGAK